MRRRYAYVRVIAMLTGVLLLVAAPSVAPGAGELMPNVQKVSEVGPQANDYFGNAVAISGDTAIVGAWLDNEKATDAGAAYVYVRAGSTWLLQQKLMADDGIAGDNAGYSVAVEGDTAVIGAWGDDANGVNAGSAYVFVRTGPTWTQQAKLTAEADAAADDRFGGSVGVSGDTAVIGAFGDDANAGSAYVFTRTGTAWSRQQRLAADDGAAEDRFGNSVAIAGDSILIGAPLTDDPSTNTGSAYAFTRADDTWTQIQELHSTVPGVSDTFGSSVALDGGTALVGAPQKYGRGVACAFTWTGATWVQQQELLAGDWDSGDKLGRSVGLSGDLAVAGASGHDASALNAGAAYVFTRSGTTWSEAKKLLAPDGADGDEYGGAVALAGGTAVVGAIRCDIEGASDAGAAYMHFTTPVVLTPVYRFYRPSSGTHFYTPNEAEKAHVIATWPTIYHYEGIAYWVNPENNTQPLYRFYNKKNGSHFYTASETEKANVIANLSATYSYDGPTYKVSTAAAPGKPPVYRFYNKKNGSHFYTASETEKANVIANLSGIYTYEGIAFWLGQ